METVISARGLTVGYGKKAVVSGIEFEALRGQLICLLGPNGAGKTTILRTLSGLLAPLGGVVELRGEDLRSLKPSAISKKLSLVLTERVSPALTTVGELVAMGRMPYTDFMGRLTDEDRRIVREALTAVGAEELRDRYYAELSDGEKQKVMIARALVQEPELMILDEPTGHLDVRHKIEVIRVLRRLTAEKKITCILSLHEIDLALKGCRTVLLVRDGAIAAQGPPEEVLRDERIQTLYGLSDARYNELFGSVELIGERANDLFVTGGNGSGIPFYRALSRSGYGLTSGVLHRNDVDFQVARAICCEVVSEAPFEPITAESGARAFDLLRAAKAAIDTGFPIGSGNRENMALLRQAVEIGKPVFSVRSAEECAAIYGETADRIFRCENVGAVSEAVQKIGSK